MIRPVLILTTLLTAAPAWAQQPAPAAVPLTARGVPDGAATPETLHLSLADAVARGLDRNLAVILQEQQDRTAGSARLQALSALLPQVNGNLHEGRQVLSTAAFGFSGFGDFPTIIGPFNLVDARVSVSAPIVDVGAWAHLKAATADRTAAAADYKQIRESVVLAVGNLYLLAQADAARLASADAQVATADALARTADDQHAAGLVPQIDLLRQQVQAQNARAQQIAAANTLAMRKLQLARAIGLPAGQAFDLTTPAAFIAAPVPDLDGAIDIAEARRQDIVSARARVDAARAEKRAAAAAYLPSLHADADVGEIGNGLSSLEKTYTIAANVRVPLFSGGRTKADTVRRDAELTARAAELADLENGVRYEVQAALLSVQSAAAGVDVAKSAADLARTQLAQADDRFRAGIANTIEVVQAQEAVARSSEQYIASLYAHAIAKAGLARAMGVVEEQFVKLVGGQQ